MSIAGDFNYWSPSLWTLLDFLMHVN